METNVKYIIEYDTSEGTKLSHVARMYGFESYDDAIDIAFNIADSEDDIYGYRIYKVTEIIERVV